MQMDRLYPPGRVWWAISNDSDNNTHPQVPSPSASCNTPDNDRLYEVLDVEKVFGQVVFAKDMLRCLLISAPQDQTNSISSSHMPHTYDRVLQQLYPYSPIVP